MFRMLGGASLPMASRGPPCWGGGSGTLELPPGPQSWVLELHPVPKHVHGKSGHPLHRPVRWRPWAQQQLAVWCHARESAHRELPFVLDSGWSLPANGERRPSLPVGAGPWGFPLGLGVIAGGLGRAVVTCFHRRSAGECTLPPLVCGDAMGESAGREPPAGTRLSGGQGSESFHLFPPPPGGKSVRLPMYSSTRLLGVLRCYLDILC